MRTKYNSLFLFALGLLAATQTLFKRNEKCFFFSYTFEDLLKTFNTESFAFVLTTEMERSSARSYTKMCKLVKRE